MTTISDPSAMTPDDPRWLSWFMQQRRFDRLSRKAQTGASLITDFAAGVYEMGYPGQRRGSYELSDIVKVSRSTGGGIINQLGQFEWVSDGVARLTYDPVTLQPLGLLIEEQRTNLLLQSAVLATQNVTVTAVAHTLSFYGTGTVTLSGVATGSKTGTGAYPALSTLTFTPAAGTLTLTVTGSVTFGQLEVGASNTSYIPTTTAQVTRAADVCSVNTLSPWLNPLKGTLVVDAIKGPMSGSIVNVVSLDAGTSGNDRIQIRFISANAGSGIVLTGGATQASMSTPAASWSVGARTRAAISYEENNFAFAVGGGVPITDNSGTVPTVSRLVIGAGPGYLSAFNGIIRSITYYPHVIDVQQASA